VGTELSVEEPISMLEIPVGPVGPTVRLELESGYGAVDGSPLGKGVWAVPVLRAVPEPGSEPEENAVPVTARDVEFEIGNGGNVDVGREVGMLPRPDEYAVPVLPLLVGVDGLVVGAAGVALVPVGPTRDVELEYGNGAVLKEDVG
jgi:hypothetical protein